MTHFQSRASITEKFNHHANQYDEQRRKLIPCFDDFYSIPISLINSKTSTPAVLDVGAGTGLFSSYILNKFPNANMTLIDLSDNMLEIAKQRFSTLSNVNYIVDDYTTHPFQQKFDIIISSLSIHHLTDMEKKDFYQQAYSMLNEGGVFINADQVLGQTEFLEELYKKDWSIKIENSGLTQEQVKAAYERTKLDKMSTLADQLTWLNNSGFEDVDCVYKYFNFVVMFARK